MVRPNESERPSVAALASEYVPQWWPGTAATGDGFAYTSSGLTEAATALHQRADALQDAVAGLHAAVAALPCGPATWYPATTLRDTCADVARIVTVQTQRLAANLRHGGDSIASSQATYEDAESTGRNAAAVLGSQLGNQPGRPTANLSPTVAPAAGAPASALGGMPAAAGSGSDLL